MDITYKEINDTFNALGKTKNYLEEKWQEIEAFINANDKFVFIGCGSSYSTAKSMAIICNMRAGLCSFALAAGDILLHANRYKKAIDGAAVVFVSRSGRTTELIIALEALKAEGCGIKVASLVCADNTPLGEKSGLTLSTPWAFDESVCQTRCVTNFYYIAAYIAAKMTKNKSELDDLNHIQTEGHMYMTDAEKLAKKIAGGNWNHAVVLADAELEGIAEEGSLVFKEVCQLPSNYYHLLDVRHGPMVLICKETLVIAALGANNTLEHNLLNDIIKKGATTVAFSDVETSENLEGILFSVYGRKLSVAAGGIPLIILCQMIAYFKSKETGADPDKPTGLDPWIAL